MKQKFYVLILGILLSFVSVAQGWLNAVKIESSNLVKSRTIITDNEGLSYIGLMFRDNCVLEDTVFYSYGAQDGLVIKFDNGGGAIFVKHIMANNKITLSRMITDKVNNVIYITGGFSDTLFVDGDTLIGQGDGKVDGFLIKMNFNGQISWCEKIAWGSNDDRGVDINIDRNGDILITGMFKDSVYIGDSSTYNSYYWANSTKDLFFAKFNSDGQFIYSKVFTTNNNADFFNSITWDNTHYYIAGYFYGTINVNGTNYNSAGNDDFILLSMSYDGNINFVKSFGGIGEEGFNDIIKGSDGYIYPVGFVGSSAVTEDGVTFGSNGGKDIAVFKIDTNGIIQWVKTYGSSIGNDEAKGVSNLDSGFVVSGVFFGNVDFDGNTYYGDDGDAYIYSMDFNGNITKFTQAYGNGTDIAWRNSVDLYSLNNNRYVLGDFASDTLFIGMDSLVRTTAASKAVFIAKYGCPETNIDFTTAHDIYCYGDSTTLVATPNVGMSPFSYSWSTGDTLDTLYNVPSGWYKLTVTDANGCLQVDSVFINQPAPLSAVMEVKNESCNGNDGRIDLTVSGGTPQYYYNWNTSDTVEDLNNLHVGNYTVTVTDLNGCQLIDSARVLPYDTLRIVANVINESCNGNDGKIEIGVSGGNPDYSYSWDNGATGAVLDNLTSGVYHVTVNDVDGCSVEDSFMVMPYDTMTVAFDVQNESCNGNDGKIIATVTGGNPPYEYTWSNSVNTASNDSISSGWYYVTVTDSRGCSIVDSAEVLPYNPLLVSASVTSESCNGNDGNISLLVSGGEAPYSYTWSTGDTSNIADSLGTGIYTFTITDHRGCFVVDSAEVLAFQPIIIYLETNSITCAGNDGSINAIVTGGTPPYTYTWSNGADTSYLNGLSGGTYYVTVEDANGCHAIDSTIIYDYTPIQVIHNVANVSCHNNDGKIDLFVSGGIQPYTYLWSNGDTIQDIDSLSAGIYTFTITDAKGCTYVDSVQVSGDMPPSIALSQTDILCAGDSTATLMANVKGQYSPYSVIWFNNDSLVIDTAISIDNMPRGIYWVNVLDNRGCVYSDTIRVVEPDSLHLQFNVTPENCKNTQTGAIELTVSGGASDIYFYNWSTGATTKNIQELSTGTYYITVTDMNNCSVSDSVLVPLTENNCNVDLVIYNILTPNGDGQNDYWEIGNIDTYPDAQVDVYNEWGNLVFSTNDYSSPWDGTDVNGKKVAAGTYYYVIKLPNGVSYSGYLTVMY